MSSMRSKVRKDQRKSRVMRRRQLANQKQRRRITSALEVLESRYLLAFTTELFFDINQFGISAIPDSLTEFNSQAFFVANDGRTGSELWKSDGTESGTVRVADINPGPDGSLPSDLTVLGNDLFFTAIDDDKEFDLWKTDGTTAGTVRVFDADAAGVYEMRNLTASGGKLFFSAYEQASGYELWASDGTSSGTALVRDINPDQSISEGPQELTDVNGTLFFTTYQSGYDNRELFESDGTLAGTVLVADIDGDSTTSSLPHNLTNVDGTLFFAAEGASDGTELYKSTGSSGSTVQVQDLVAGSGSSYPESLTPLNGQLFFSALDGSAGRQLYRTDGNTITLVANTTVGAAGSSNPTDLVVMDNELFFAADGGVVPGTVSADGPTLTSANSFRSSSSNYAGLTVATTGFDRGQLRTATSSPLSYTLSDQTATDDGPGTGWVEESADVGDLGVGLTNVSIGDLVFRDVDSGDLSTHAWEWTISDSQGLSGINFSGFASGNEFNDANEGLLFELFLNGSATRTSMTQVAGNDLDNWLAGRNANNISLSDAGGPTITTATVRMTFGIDGGPAVYPSTGDESLVVNASLTATGQSSGVAGREIHKTDGTTTALVKDIVFDGTSNPTHLTEVDGQLFFSADDPTGLGRELWVSDGTAAGTTLVRDTRTGFDAYGAPLSGDPQNLKEINGQLFFTALDNLNDRELWTSDGTTPNSNQLKNINPGSEGANIQQVVQVGSKLFFVADDGINGEAVWVADPALGTAVIAADVTASPSDRINGLAAYGNGVIFHNDSLGVYTTDGTTTTAITGKTPVALDDEGTLFVEANGLAFFVLPDLTFGEELWMTDGTASGTSMVIDLDPGVASSAPRELIEFNNLLYFVAIENSDFDTAGREVFQTDGTEENTFLAADINLDPDPDRPDDPVNLSSDPEDFVVSGGRLFFTANSGVLNGDTGRELWSIDGPGGFATLVKDIRSGAGVGSDPVNLTDVGGVLYFSANDGSGYEPYVSDNTTGGTVRLADINSGSGGSSPSGFQQAGSTVYFSAFQPGIGYELWGTDGTPTGTTLVMDIRAGVDSSNPMPLGEVGQDRLLFAATASGVDRELWMVGGDVNPPVQVVDMNPGELFGSNASDLREVGTDRLFVADDGLRGNEIYQLREVVPQVENVVIDDGTDQRSSIEHVTVTFNSIVEFTGDPFDVQNVSTSATVAHIPSISVVDGKTVVDLTFAAGDSVNANGLLLDGFYQLTIDATLVNAFGTQLDGDDDGDPGGNYELGASPLDKFYRKFGDGNGSGVVDLLDFAAFRQAFGSSPSGGNWNHAYDNDGDDTVGLLDFAAFRQNFGT